MTTITALTFTSREGQTSIIHQIKPEWRSTFLLMLLTFMEPATHSIEWECAYSFRDMKRDLTYLVEDNVGVLPTVWKGFTHDFDKAESLGANPYQWEESSLPDALADMCQNVALALSFGILSKEAESSIIDALDAALDAQTTANAMGLVTQSPIDLMEAVETFIRQQKNA